jgi:hypothetical protein
VHVDADEVTGIREPSRLMVDKITTIPRSKLGERIGQLRDDELVMVQESEVEVTAIRAQGAGGQHVNKVSSAIHLRFDVMASSFSNLNT